MERIPLMSLLYHLYHLEMPSGKANLEEAAKALGEIHKPPVTEMPISTTLEIGKRGPEGAIIDYLKANPETAKSFGWKEGENITKWAGGEAHQLWLEHAKEALQDENTLAKMKELGYSQDMKGYGEMMRRIGEGKVQIDFKEGKISLGEKTEYLYHKPAVSTEYQKDGGKIPDVKPEDLQGKTPINKSGKIPDVKEENLVSGGKSKAGVSEILKTGEDKTISKDLPLSKDAWEAVKNISGVENAENYKAIAKVPIKKLFEEIPAGKSMSEIWSESKGIDLPHKGFFGLTYSQAEVKKIYRIQGRARRYGETIDQLLSERVK
jgi:hypothetical protein